MIDAKTLDDLEAKAKAATSKDWKVGPNSHNNGGYGVHGALPRFPNDDSWKADCRWQVDADFIAAANPATVLALIAEIRQSQQSYGNDYCVACAEASED